MAQQELLREIHTLSHKMQIQGPIDNQKILDEANIMSYYCNGPTEDILENITSVKTSIFNIYDDDILFHLDYFKNTNTHMSIKMIYKNRVSIIDKMKDLFDFFYPNPHRVVSLPRQCILHFGTLYHTTALCFRKMHHGIIQVVYINTGEGFDLRNTPKNGVNGKWYYKLFNKTFYLNPSMYESFLMFIRPFIFYKDAYPPIDKYYASYILSVMTNFSKKLLGFTYEEDPENPYNANNQYNPDDPDTRSFYNNCFFTKADMNKYKHINDWYVVMFIRLQNSDDTYAYLNEVFNETNILNNINGSRLEFTSKQISHIRRIKTKYYQITCNNFKATWDRVAAETIDQINAEPGNSQDIIDRKKHQINYLNKALDNISFINYDNDLYFTLQLAGTCQFKSTLMALMYCLLYNNDYGYDCSVLYNRLAINCFTVLEEFINNNLLFSYASEYLNTSLLINELIKDNIIDNKYNFFDSINNNYNNIIDNGKIFQYIPLTHNIRTITIKHATIKATELDEVIDLLRNNPDKDKIKIKIVLLIDKYIKRDDHIRTTITNSYYELLIIGILWELYFNYENWKDLINNRHDGKIESSETKNYNYIFLKILNRINIRINLTQTEILWLCKFNQYYFINNNQAFIEKCDIIKLFYSYNNTRSKYKKIKDGLHHKNISFFNDSRDIPYDNNNYYKPVVGIDIFNIDSKSELFTIDKLDEMRSLMTNRNNKREGIVEQKKAYREMTLNRGASHGTDEMGRIILFINNFILFDNDINLSNSIDFYLDKDILNINSFIINYFIENSDFLTKLPQEGDFEQYNLKYLNMLFVFKLYANFLPYDVQKTFVKSILKSCDHILNFYDSESSTNLLFAIINTINIILKNDNFNIDTREYYSTYYDMGNVVIDTIIPRLYYTYNNETTNIIIHDILQNIDICKIIYPQILKYLEDNVELNSYNIMNIISKINIIIDSPYFKINKVDTTKMDLIIDNNTITQEFIKLEKVPDGFKDFNTIMVLCDILLNEGQFINSIFISTDWLVIILEKKNYYNKENTPPNMSNDIIIAFNIQCNLSTYRFTFIKTKKIYINSYETFLSNNINKYPFLAFAPKYSLNFIDLKNNIVHCISNNKQLSRPDVFTKIINENMDNYYMALYIKPNFLTPYLNNTKYIRIMHTHCKSYINYLPDIFKDELPDQLNNKIDLTILPGLNKLAYFLPRIDSLLNDITFNILGILEMITNMSRLKPETQDKFNIENKDKNLDFIDWINSQTNSDINSIVKYNDEFICSVNCRNIGGDIAIKLEDFITALQKLRSYLSTKINHNYETYLDFLINNYTVCSYVMIINIYIISLSRLLYIITECENLSCHEIIEINEIFNKKPKKVTVLSAIVEIIFGNIIKEEQWDKINSIYNNFEHRANEKHQVHQFMMGKGKSSIITPMLSIMILNNLSKDENQSICIVVPEHLKKQTEKTFSEFTYYFNMIPKIKTDIQIKLDFLNRKDFSKTIFLIDEFDYMYNPIQSNFNIIEYSKELEEEMIFKTFDITMNILINNIKSVPDDSQIFSTLKEIINIINDEKNIKNVTFGMSIMKPTNRYCIPYLRKDSPNEGSTFSSNIYTIVTTILYFYNPINKLFTLESYDLFLINKNNKRLFIKISKIYDIFEDDITNFVNKFNKLKGDDKYKLPHNIFYEYLQMIIKELKESIIIRNCSFIDIINIESLWQVGYSGTVNINMDIEPITKYNKYDHNIVEDPDEQINVRKALLSGTLYKFSKNPINYDIIFNIIIRDNINVIIDACAVFKDLDNKDVAEILYNKYKEKGSIKIVIYLLKDDTKMMYNGSHNLYEEKNTYNSATVVYYYSQRHIIGIDFKQPNILEGIVLLDKNNNYTQISQAIYRMRKLNKGHTISVGFVDNILPINTLDEIYDLINQNELTINKQNNPLLKYQYLKYFTRKYATNSYFEYDLEPLKDGINLSGIESMIYNKFIRNIMHNPSDNEDIKKQLLILDSPIPLKRYPSSNMITDINIMADEILKFSIDTKLNLFFNTNTIQVDISRAVETQVVQAIETQRTSQKITKAYTDNLAVSIKYNPYEAIAQFMNFTYLRLIYTKDDTIYTLLFSYNLFKNIMDNDTCIIIELEKYDNNIIYLIDHISLLNHYIYIRPIYNNKGKLINNFIFKQNKNIDFNEIFNINLKNETTKNIIEFGYIMFGIINETQIPVNLKINNTKFEAFEKLVAYSNIDIFSIKDPVITKIINKYIDNNVLKGNLFDVVNYNPIIFTQYLDYINNYYRQISYSKRIKSNSTQHRNRGLGRGQVIETKRIFAFLNNYNGISNEFYDNYNNFLKS